MTSRSSITFALWIALALPASAGAQDGVLMPAESARQRAQEQAPVSEAPPPPAAPAPAVPVADASAPADTSPAALASAPAPAQAPMTKDAREPSYAARAVVQPAAGSLREEQRIGSYAQPRWSARRRFPGTRMYVVPAGTLGVEWWLEDKQSLAHGRDVRYRSLYEFEMGLGHRLQLDLYLQTEQSGHQRPLRIGAEKVELRYALADWGAIPLNPTLYAELTRQDAAPPLLELKALFGEQLAPRWHIGFNLVFEHLLGGDQRNEYALTTGLSYSLVDERFALGAEVKLETVDHSGARLAFDDWEVLVGPSLAWSPVAPMHVLFAPLFGTEREQGSDTPLFEPTVVVGWEL
jgi:hypothetical protein